MAFTEQTAKYLKESFFEMKNVTWPTKAEVRQHTILVVAISLAVALFLGLCDFVLSSGLTQLLSLLHK